MLLQQLTQTTRAIFSYDAKLECNPGKSLHFYTLRTTHLLESIVKHQGGSPDVIATGLCWQCVTAARCLALAAAIDCTNATQIFQPYHG